MLHPPRIVMDKFTKSRIVGVGGVGGRQQSVSAAWSKWAITLMMVMAKSFALMEFMTMSESSKVLGSVFRVLLLFGFPYHFNGEAFHFLTKVF